MWREIIAVRETHYRMLDRVMAAQVPDPQQVAVARQQLRSFEDRLLRVAGVGLDRLRSVYAPEMNASVSRFVAFGMAILKDWDVTEKPFSEYTSGWPGFDGLHKLLAILAHTSSGKIREAFESDEVAVRRKEFGAKKAAMLVAARVWGVSEKTVERRIKQAPRFEATIKVDERGVWSQWRSS